MGKFFVDSKQVFGNTIRIIDKNEINHIVKARRLNEGDKIDIFDDKQNSYKGIIDKIKENEIMINIVETLQCNVSTKQNIKLTIACAIPKKAKFEYIIEKLTELGVSKIIPIITSRTIVRLSSDKAKQRIERFRKIAKEAAKQSSNPIITEICEINNFKDVFDRAQEFDLILIPTLVETLHCNVSTSRFPIKSFENDKRYKKILVLIGPEGDFTSEEIQFAIKHGAKPVSLGKRVLKVDTAAIFVASIINANI